MSSVDARSHNIQCICDETRKDGQLEVVDTSGTLSQHPRRLANARSHPAIPSSNIIYLVDGANTSDL